MTRDEQYLQVLLNPKKFTEHEMAEMARQNDKIDKETPEEREMALLRQSEEQ